MFQGTLTGRIGAVLLMLVTAAQGMAETVEIDNLFSPLGAKSADGLTHFRVSAPGTAALKAAPGGVLLKSLPLPDGNSDLSLEPFSPFTADARIVLKDGDSESLLARTDAQYFRGESSTGAAAFLRVSDGGDLFAMVAGDNAPATVLRTQDGEGYSRPVNASEAEAYCPGGIVSPDTPAAMPWEKRIDKAALSEYRILVDMENRLLRGVFRGDEDAAIAYVADIFGVVSAVYLRDVGFTLKVSDLVLWGSPATFELPLVSASSPTYNNLLTAYQTFDSTRTGYQRHLSHLLSAKLPSYGSTIGLAFVGATCSGSFKQGSATLNGQATLFDPNTNELDPMTVAHEIGHNFNCTHSNDGTIMDAAASSSLAFNFGASSIATIQNFVASAPCFNITQEQCAPDSLYGQKPAATVPVFGASAISDIDASNVAAFDDFSGLSADIGRVRWWGVQDGCSRTVEEFSIVFHNDLAGLPGGLVATFDVTATPVNTGLTLDGDPVVEYEVELPSVVSLATGWLSIVGINDTGCAFRWASSTTANQTSVTSTDGDPAIAAAGDRAFCLSPQVDVDPATGITCPEGTVYSQAVNIASSPLITANRFASNEGTQQYFESFSGVTGEFNRVDWWGWALDASDLDCARTPDSFEVAFFPTGSNPGTAIATFNVTPTVEEVGVENIPTLLHYSIDLPEPLALTEGIIQIRGTGDTSCKFSWALSEDGDNKFSFMTTGPGFFFFNNLDGAFCLSGPVVVEGEGIAEGVLEGEGVAEGIVEGEGIAEGIVEGEGVVEGIVEGEGIAEGIIEGEGVAEGIVEGEGIAEGIIEGEGIAEGVVEGEGIVEGVFEGEGVADGEGILEGEGVAEGEGVFEGEGTTEGTADGEGEFLACDFVELIPGLFDSVDADDSGGWSFGEISDVVGAFISNPNDVQIIYDAYNRDGVGEITLDDIATFALEECAIVLEGEGTAEGEGVVEGEGAAEGEGVLEGEGAVEGEGVNDGEGNTEGEGSPEGEGEGLPLDPYEQLLYSFASTDTDTSRGVTYAEVLVQFPGFTLEDFNAADANGDGALTVAELLNFSGAGILISADIDGNFEVALEELLRVIQFYNAAGYACAENPGATEDGFEPRAPEGGDPGCLLHSIDTNGDNIISLSELLRAIQLFNFAGYQFCEGLGEDGFCARV